MTTPDVLTIAEQTLLYLAPEVLILVSATVMMTLGAFVRWPRAAWSGASAVVLVAALAILLVQKPGGPEAYAAIVSPDALAAYARLGLILTGLILLALAHDQVGEDRAAEFFGSLLMIHAGAMLVASANELVFLFVGLELVSIPTYLILYLPRRNAVTQEAATKYFYLSIFSSGLLLFGLAYLYGLTGLSNLKGLAYLTHWSNAALNLPHPGFAVVALVFVMAGLGFRVAAVPFHFYAPDVYQGSPTVLAAMLSWVPKAVGFLAIVRTLTAVFGIEAAAGGTNLATVSDRAVVLAWLVAVATMTLGNTVALAQRDLKRLLAYSSIAHAGYLMIGVAAAFRNSAAGSEAVLGADGIVFYLATYALMTLGAFGVILALSTPERPVETIDDLAGLMRTRPWAALAMTLCLFSLAGVPPLAGFWGKFRIFQAALEAAQGPDAGAFQLLTVLGVLNAAVGAYYYLRIVVEMTLKDPKERLEPRAPWATQLAVGACATLSLFLGLFPAPIAAASRASAAAAVALPEPRPDGPDAEAAPQVVRGEIGGADRGRLATVLRGGE
jgi:NADH-quinone oxidoreductase subunit N